MISDLEGRLASWEIYTWVVILENCGCRVSFIDKVLREKFFLAILAMATGRAATILLFLWIATRKLIGQQMSIWSFFKHSSSRLARKNCTWLLVNWILSLIATILILKLLVLFYDCMWSLLGHFIVIVIRVYTMIMIIVLRFLNDSSEPFNRRRTLLLGHLCFLHLIGCRMYISCLLLQYPGIIVRLHYLDRLIAMVTNEVFVMINHNVAFFSYWCIFCHR